MYQFQMAKINIYELLKILDRDKNQNNIFRSSWIFILATWINSINICIGNILVIYINICPNIMPNIKELWNNIYSSCENWHKLNK